MKLECEAPSLRLLAGVAAAVACRRVHLRYKGHGGARAQSLVRGSFADDAALAFDEVLNTAEDAALHLRRLAPWLCKPDSGSDLLERPDGQRRVVILGTGWAAHALTKVIDASANDVCVVSPRNYFIFTPMLAAASVGSVEYRSILEHIRSANPTVKFYQGTCEAVDVEKHEILVRPEPTDSGKNFSISYDVLVVAVGLRPSALGVPGVERHCLFLKDVQDARRLRRLVTEHFECADLPEKTDLERRQLLTFAVVGGGPTGCEFCGELSDFVRNDLRRFYPKLAPVVRILLFHRGAEVLPSFGEALQQSARETLEGQGIEVITSSKVVAVEEKALVVEQKGGERKVVDCSFCVWAAGQGGQDIVKSLHAQLLRQQELSAQDAGSSNQLYVDKWLRVFGVSDGSLLALGDCARVLGSPLPQTAQVAAQQGAYAARLLNRQYNLATSAAPQLRSKAALPQLLKARGQTDAAVFHFLDLGRLAYLGQEQAVAELGFGSTTVSRARGVAAFLLWRSVYLVKQVSFRNRVLVLFDWMKSRVFGRDLTRF